MSLVPWAFSDHFILLDNFSDQRDEELPTLLHFAAKYGLKNLTALLLTCPGAIQAYSVANKHGHYPNTIAEKHGFRDLRQFIDEYVVRSRRERPREWEMHHVVPRAAFAPKIWVDFISSMSSCASAGRASIHGLKRWALESHVVHVCVLSHFTCVQLFATHGL